MKKVIILVGSVVTFASCQQNGKQTADQANQDTVGLAAFKEAQLNAKADSIAKQMVEQKMMEAKAIQDSTLIAVAPAPTRTVYVQQAPKKAAAKKTTTRRSNSTNSTGNNGYNNQPVVHNPQPAPQTQPENKGISKAAKGAIIGGAAGAAAGAILNKQNRAIGGAIGAAAGGAIGYGVGRSMDKKDGRVK